MKVKINIHTDGIDCFSRRKCVVTNAETGEIIEGVQSVDFHADLDNYYAMIKVIYPRVEIEGFQANQNDPIPSYIKNVKVLDDLNGLQTIKITTADRESSFYYDDLKAEFKPICIRMIESDSALAEECV